MRLRIKRSQPKYKPDAMTGIYKSANSAWQNIYYFLNVSGYETCPRGIKVKESITCDIYITNPRDNLVYNRFRESSPYYIAQEYYWYISGDRRVESISKYSKFWEKIANSDGTINSNYGAYIFDKNYYPVDGKSQWEYLIETLRKDRDSRQAILQIPITPFKGTKDVCCTSSLQFFIRNGKLFMTTYMRSNDINLGFCNDIPFFTSLQISLAEILGVDLGFYRHVVGSMHVYENNFIENVEQKTGKKFKFEDIQGYKLPDNYDFKFDYEVLRHRSKEGLDNKILKYMADNFDKRGE